ncbi:S8 family peptidase [Streptomyces aidingensis]|uniref:Subtilase family protein n=1 Tax=Streptomyces aidingensis TaxID=910347 RepID=A0A1I1H060_9ACTN|nr:S8 family serine peptidase [Streptomyces aidingensis]SFC17136.1 Subtilase family protein [Streptomyces aidingensis]
MSSATARLTWSLGDRPPDRLAPGDGGSHEVVPDPWAWSHGAGVRVCVVDTGVEDGHRSIGRIQGAYEVVRDGTGELTVRETDGGDACGHGTACAGLIRRVAPECELYSVRVLGKGFTGTGAALLTGLRWAVEQGFPVVNLSLSTTRRQFLEALRSLADQAYFDRVTLVASAHNSPVESYPWRFSSVISVGSHREDDPGLFLYNPDPPVEFFAPGQNVYVAWLNGTCIRTTGNSFATPFISGLCARLLGSHPGLTPFQVKNALYLAAANVRTAAAAAGEPAGEPVGESVGTSVGDADRGE